MAKIKPKIYAQALYELCQKSKDINLVLRDFLAVLRDHSRLSAVNQIMREFSSIYDRNEASFDVEVNTAHALDEKETEQIKELAKDFKRAKKIALKQKIDPQILGGVKILIGDMLFDDSLKNKLSLFKKNINK